MSTKKSISKTDSVVVKYIISAMAKNPLVFIPIIQTIMDPKNPDSPKLRDQIVKSITSAIVGDKQLKKLCLDRILENIQTCTDQEIFNIVNDQRLQLEEDSKKFIESIQKQTTVTLCEKYFKTKKEIIDKIFDDYFKELSKSIADNVEALNKRTKDVLIEKSDENSVNIKVPNSMKNKVIEYVKFLETQQ